MQGGRLFLTENRYDSTSSAFELLKERYPNDPVTRGVENGLGRVVLPAGTL